MSASNNVRGTDSTPPEKQTTPLSAKQARFCQEYVIDHNGSKAAIRAGYSKRSAKEQASRLMTKANIEARISELETEIATRLRFSADDVKARLWAIATADRSQIMQIRRRCCRFCHGEGFRYQRTVGERESSLEGFEQSERQRERDAKEEGIPFVAREFDEKGGVGWDPRLFPHPECPECFGEGKQRSFFGDTSDMSAELRAAFAGIKVTKDGTQILFEDALKALELCGKTLGIFIDKKELGGSDGAPIQVANFEEFLAKIYGAASEEA